MAALEALLFFVLLPAGTSVLASLLLRSAADETVRSFPADAFPNHGKGRLSVALAVAAVPTPLGLVLWSFASPVVAAVDGNNFPQASDVDRLILWASIAYALAAIGSTVSVVVCIRSRMAGFLGSDFGRVLPIAVTPFTGVVFAMVLDFFLLSYLSGYLPGESSVTFATVGAVDAAVSAFQAYVVATLAYPVATYVSNRVRDLGTRGLTRALLIMEMGELPVLAGLILGFLAIGELNTSPP